MLSADGVLGSSRPKPAWTNHTLHNDIGNAIQKHVYGRMPIRMIKVPGMSLLSRSGVVKDMKHRIFGAISEAKFEDMVTHKLLREIIHSEEEAKWRVIQDILNSFGAYAILSHTWLQDEDDPELTYGDLMRTGLALTSINNRSNGAGYRKLEGFCKAAHVDGYSYAWMDTICINQDSTSELDESIRSMYRWYQHSSLCIAHMADTVSLSDMKHDRWFTRGWTLQELLAPKKIKFYDKNWNILGYTGLEIKNLDDDDICAGHYTNNKEIDTEVDLIVEKVVGISSLERINYRPGVSSTVEVSRRMRWAANRTTTREEDQAYCLMGIFGVSFSIAYGEGPERAFFRLIEAILTSFRDISDVLTWGGKPISDEIHSSSLIPSSPKCYLRSSTTSSIIPAAGYIPSEPLLLTHLGLRIRVLLIKGHYRSSISKFVDGADISIDFKLKGYQRPILWHEYNAAIRLQGNNRELIRQALVLGIWNIEDDSNVVVIPPIPCAFLFEVVRRTKRNARDTLVNNPITPNSKVHTREGIRFVSSVSPSSHTRILKENLIFSLASIHTLYL